MTTSLVPKGKRPTDLTVAELSYISRNIKADVMAVLGNKENPHPERIMALAYLALCWAKREDVGARIDQFTKLGYTELLELLAVEDTEEDDPQPDDLEEEIEANPTESLRVLP